MVVTRTWTSRAEKELKAKLKTENINSSEEISFKDKRNKAIADRCCAVSRGDGRMVGYFHSDGDEPCHCLSSGPQSPVLVSLPSPLHPTVLLPMSSERDFSKVPITKGHDLITFKRHSRPSCGAERPLPVTSLPASHHWFSQQGAASLPVPSLPPALCVHPAQGSHLTFPVLHLPDSLLCSQTSSHHAGVHLSDHLQSPCHALVISTRCPSS